MILLKLNLYLFVLAILVNKRNCESFSLSDGSVPGAATQNAHVLVKTVSLQRNPLNHMVTSRLRPGKKHKYDTLFLGIEASLKKGG